MNKENPSTPLKDTPIDPGISYDARETQIDDFFASVSAEIDQKLKDLYKIQDLKNQLRKIEQDENLQRFSEQNSKTQQKLDERMENLNNTSSDKAGYKK